MTTKLGKHRTVCSQTHAISRHAGSKVGKGRYPSLTLAGVGRQAPVPLGPGVTLQCKSGG